MSAGAGGCNGTLILFRAIRFVGGITRMGSRDWTAAHGKVEREGRCRVGSLECSGPVDPAHIVPRSQVGPPHGDDEKNICPLCRFHHELFDRGELDLLPYLSKVEQAYAVLLVGFERAGRYMKAQRRPDRAEVGVTAEGDSW